MGKRKITHEGNYDKIFLPSANDVLGVAVKMLGCDRIMANAKMAKNVSAGYGEK